jgi:serine/threonine protein kinase
LHRSSAVEWADASLLLEWSNLLAGCVGPSHEQHCADAQVLATLNHPHIGAIYGLEDPDGIRALVLELVDGETLLEKLAQGGDWIWK